MRWFTLVKLMSVIAAISLVLAVLTIGLDLRSVYWCDSVMYYRYTLPLLGDGSAQDSVAIGAWSQDCRIHFHCTISHYDGYTAGQFKQQPGGFGFDARPRYIPVAIMRNTMGFYWATRVTDNSRSSGYQPLPGVLGTAGKYVATRNYVNGFNDVTRSIQFMAPHWFYSCLFSIAPVWWALQFFRHRARPGHCRRCGYDLRATPHQCPECGNEVTA